MVIAGTGRAGTTFMIHLLTELGLETGFSPDNLTQNIDENSNAGLEFPIEDLKSKKLPRIIESPYFYKVIDQVINNPDIEIEHILIPVRHLELAAKSRMRVQQIAEKKVSSKFFSDSVAGGLTNSNFLEKQEVELGRQFISLIKSVAKTQIPHTFLAFPSMINDPTYLFKKLMFLIPNISEDTFLEIHKRIAKPKLVHNFREIETTNDAKVRIDDLLFEITSDQYLYQVDNYAPSAWIGHAPFMKFLIKELKPKTFVELGVQHGFSYFVACQAIKECNLSTNAFAVDHFLGDTQTGRYDKSVLNNVKSINKKYSKFSTILESSFLQALPNFTNNSIDLLHIDGFHSYESVKEDFYNWLPKLSKNGIVLLHDIHVRRKTFGVYIFWRELKQKFTTIEFTTSHGLGVVFLGDVTAGRLNFLLEAFKLGYQYEIQGTFASISDEVMQKYIRNDIAILELERDSAILERDSIIDSSLWRIFKPYRNFKDKF